MSFDTPTNFCCFYATSAGSGAFVVSRAYDVASALLPTYDVPANCGAILGKVYHYYAQSADGTQQESGLGTYYPAGTLNRQYPTPNSDGTTTPCVFLTAPIVQIYPSASTITDPSGFVSGTRVAFCQASAPVGWTVVSGFNDYALRVNGTTGGGVGGIYGFSTIFARYQTDSHTLTVTEMPSHTHSYSDDGGLPYVGPLMILNSVDGSGVDGNLTTNVKTTGSTGSDGGHFHGNEMRVLYVDIIICQKN